MMTPREPTNFAEATAIRSERLELVRAVLHIQQVYFELWGKWPSAQDVADRLTGITAPE